MITLKEALKNELDFVKNHGGYWELTEFDGGINDIQREKIKAFKEYYGQCFLGKINYYDKERKNINNIEILTEYTGQNIYNFEYAFCIPQYDIELTELIKTYNRPTEEGFNSKKVMNDITIIFNRIEKLNGCNLTWV